MRSGMEVLLTDRQALLKGKRVGLICNPTSITRSFEHSVDVMRGLPGVKLVRLFGPEHGVRGDAQDMITVESEVDAHSGLPVVSLYGAEESSLKPTLESLHGLDVLVFDIQDIGARYYTFVYTMAYCMEAAAEAGIPIIVCDRPNPITGLKPEGNLVDMAFRSFVGRYPLPARHGLTAGELARYFQAHFDIRCELTVVEVEGWTRAQWYEQTGLPWVQPSPNMPTVDTALVYPGMCLIEGTNVSEGRGTTRPFHLVGAPWIDAFALSCALDGERLPGVRWRPTWFTPMFHKYGRQLCAGVEVHVTDRESFEPFLSGIALIRALHMLFPQDFRWRTERYEFVSDKLAIDLLLGGDQIRAQVEKGVSLAEIRASWQDDVAAFRAKASGCLLYEV